MQAFGELLERLVYATARNAKLRLLEAYFRATPDPDRGWALAALTDGLPFSLPIRKALGLIMEPHVDPVLYRLSRDYVGDTAETVALLWPDRHIGAPPSVAEAVDAARRASALEFPQVLAGLLDRLDAKSRFALIKLYSGALRVGISARLAKMALAAVGGKSVDDIEELWHGFDAPYTELFAWIDGGAKPAPRSRLTFKPVMLAHPLEEADRAAINPADFAVEWKWDGIRIQIAAGGGAARLFSRAGEEVSAAFPDVARAFAHATGVLDGELLVLRDGEVASFNDLQQRLNRKTVTARMLAEAPAHARLYDILFDGDEDLRALSLDDRRVRLHQWRDRESPANADISARIDFGAFEKLEALWSNTRAQGVEGLMLKRRASTYLAGRPRGHWFKWKRAALTLDCVLMYAQRGSGKRSSFYSDYTFGVWDGDKLVPVGKSYSGFTDEELKRLDKWVRDNTTERFGPVRAVSPGLVLEIAFDAIQASTRHKSGVAMRFPRVHRIRWDKPAAEADSLGVVKNLVV
jgi:DNA ligase 1